MPRGQGARQPRRTGHVDVAGANRVAPERAMVRAILTRDGWRSGFAPTGADLEAVTAPFRMLFGSDDPTGSVELWRRRDAGRRWP
jgi:hypothetical protein